MTSRSEIKQEFDNLIKRSSKVLVFYVKIDDIWDDDYKFETALRILPFRQQTKIISKKFVKDAKTSLANQLLQYFISSLITNETDLTNLKFKRNQYGKPYLPDADFSFSMSNQQGFTSMVVDFNSNEIGIDLAHTDDVEKFGDDYFPHFKDIFHEDEYEKLEKYDNVNRKLVFTEYWALKESYTKKLGIGLNGDLKSYNFKNVPLLSPNSTNTTGNYFKLRNSDWNNDTKLFIFDNYESSLIINLTLIDPKLVVSICGTIQDKPDLVEVPLASIVDYLM